MLELKDVKVIFNEGTSLEKIALEEFNVQIQPGEFVTILGSNGAGKSTLFNVITGTVSCQSGQIYLDGKDITQEKEYRRSKDIGRLFQNPSQGTAPNLSIEENLALAYRRNSPPFSFAVRKKEREVFVQKLAMLEMGLEHRLKMPVGLLSGGQRQAIALMMSILNPPKLLLLDEHTAALDPKSAQKILQMTDHLIRENKMTAMMITHNMKDALEYGDRLLILNNGKVTYDFSGEKKKQLKISDLIELYDA